MGADGNLHSLRIAADYFNSSAGPHVYSYFRSFGNGVRAVIIISGQSNLTYGRIAAASFGPPNMNGSIVFAKLRQCACLCNTCFVGPVRFHNPNGISICSAIFAQFTAECRRACPGMFFSIKIAPSHGGSGPHLINDSLVQSKPMIQTASRSVQPFLHR